MNDYVVSGTWPAAVVEGWVLDSLKRATSVAALRASLARGRRRKNDADGLATTALREVLNDTLPLRAVVVIGEGKADEAPMLYIGEELGPPGSLGVELAVDPIDGTTPCAIYQPGAISVIAAAIRGQGSLFACEHEGYMDKFAVGPKVVQVWKELCDAGETVHDFNPCFSPFDQPLECTVRAIAYALDKPVTNLVAGMLRRARNRQYADILEQMGVQVAYYGDGDVALGIGTTDPDHHVDFALGSGGSPEATIAAAGVKVGGGNFWARWFFESEAEKARQIPILEAEGVDPYKVYTMEDLAAGHVMFAYTAITATTLLDGVRTDSHNVQIAQCHFGRSRKGTDGIQTTRHRMPPESFTNWSELPDMEL